MKKETGPGRAEKLAALELCCAILQDNPAYTKEQASLKMMISEIKTAGEAARSSEINYRRTGSRFYLVPGL